jgi:hypothetical protein
MGVVDHILANLLDDTMMQHILSILYRLSPIFLCIHAQRFNILAAPHFFHAQSLILAVKMLPKSLGQIMLQ